MEEGPRDEVRKGLVDVVEMHELINERGSECLVSGWNIRTYAEESIEGTSQKLSVLRKLMGVTMGLRNTVEHARQTRDLCNFVTDETNARGRYVIK